MPHRAAAMVGISVSVLYRWLDTYSDFREALLQAETEYQAFALGTVNDGIANGDGHLAMKLLGARFSDEGVSARRKQSGGRCAPIFLANENASSMV